MIRAVIRALSVLEAFDNEHLDLSLQDISERIGMAKATAFRLVNTLESAGYLMHTESRRYCLAPKILVLAGRVPGNFMVRDLARPLMRELSNHMSETITLNEASGPNRICIDVVDTPSPLMSIARPGETTPLAFGATGRILLAYLGEEEFRLAVEPYVADKSVDLVSLQRELARFRQQGYAITRGQRVPGITAIAAPIFDGEGNVTHCIALTGPSVRVDPSETEFIDRIVEASQKVSRQLGSSLIEPGDSSADSPPLKKRKPRRPKETAQEADPAPLKTPARSAPQQKARKKIVATKKVAAASSTRNI